MSAPFLRSNLDRHVPYAQVVLMRQESARSIGRASRVPRRRTAQGKAYLIAGYTRDSAGVPVGSVVVKLFRTSTDALIATTISNPESGYYSFSRANDGIEYYCVAYLDGSPGRFGTTVNTLTAT